MAEDSLQNLQSIQNADQLLEHVERETFAGRQRIMVKLVRCQNQSLESILSQLGKNAHPCNRALAVFGYWQTSKLDVHRSIGRLVTFTSDPSQLVRHLALQYVARVDDISIVTTNILLKVCKADRIVMISHLLRNKSMLASRSDAVSKLVGELITRGWKREARLLLVWCDVETIEHICSKNRKMISWGVLCARRPHVALKLMTTELENAFQKDKYDENVWMRLEEPARCLLRTHTSAIVALVFKFEKNSFLRKCF